MKIHNTGDEAFGIVIGAVVQTVAIVQPKHWIELLNPVTPISVLEVHDAKEGTEA